MELSPAGVAVVEVLWRRVEERDWDGVRALLAEDFVADWPHTGERFRRDGYVELNRNFPIETWRIELQRLAEGDGFVVAEVHVPWEGGRSFCVGYYESRGGLISCATEYWIDQDPAAAPEWRARWREPA